jgi:PAS domain S-box-containing protein
LESPTPSTRYAWLEALPHPAAVLSIDGEVLALNPRWGAHGLRVGDRPARDLADLTLPCENEPGAWQAWTRQGTTWRAQPFADERGESRVLLTETPIADRPGTADYELVVEGQTEMICRFLPDTTLTFVNAAYCRYFGRSREALVGRSFLELVPPEAEPGIRETLAQYRPESPTHAYTHPVTRPDGSEGWQTWTDRAFFDERGRVVEFQSIGRDVTEQVEAERKLRQSEERYRAAAEGGLDAFFLLEAVRDDAGAVVDFRFVDLNERAADMVSRRARDVVGKQLCVEFPINRTGGFFDRYVNVLETGEPLYDEFEISAQEEGIRAAWMEHQVVPVGDGVAISARDITERKHTQLELEKERRETQTILDLLPAFVFYKDTQNNILRINRTAAEAAGFTAAEMEGHPTATFYPEHAEAYHRDDLAVIQSGKPKLGYVEPIKMPGDQTRWVRTDKVPVFDRQGRATGVIAVATDVTELKQTSEKLMESERRYRGLFERVPVAVIEHDLTEVGRWMGRLRGEGVTDWRGCIEARPEALAEVMGRTRLSSINPAACELFGASGPDDLSDAIREGRAGPSTEALRFQLELIWRGEADGEVETTYRTLTGQRIDVLLRVEVPEPEGVPDLSRVLLAMTDIRANRQRMFAQAQVEQAGRERRRLGSELHDTLGQQLTGINMLAESLRRRLASQRVEEADRVAELVKLVAQANAEVRRLISGLTPDPITGDQLETALESLAEATALVHQLDVTFACPHAPDELDPDTATHLLMIAQEAAHNAAKHARADRIRITLDQSDDGLRLQVRDDGVGLGAADARAAPAAGTGRGHMIMRYRAETIGATLDLHSPPDGGTTVRCHLPAVSASPTPENAS